MINVRFCYDIDSPFRFHRNYQGAESSISQSERSYDSSEDMIDDLIRHKNHFCCHHCERGLFFPLTCTELADTEVFEEGGGVEAGDGEILGDDADFVF